jgi:hypothetical protein
MCAYSEKGADGDSNARVNKYGPTPLFDGISGWKAPKKTISGSSAISGDLGKYPGNHVLTILSYFKRLDAAHRLPSTAQSPNDNVCVLLQFVNRSQYLCARSMFSDRFRP